jgi:predicted GIY-YIG superfamily endonuclease
MRGYHCVDILVSSSDPARHYTGSTNDLRPRLKAHNAGGVPRTAKHRPWRVDVAIAFSDRERAAAFETHLKSHSGRAFASKHF